MIWLPGCCGHMLMPFYLFTNNGVWGNLLYHNTPNTGNSFFAHNSSPLPTAIWPKVLLMDLFPSLYFTYLFCYCFPFVLRLLHNCFRSSDLELLSHMVSCAAQPYQSAVLSLLERVLWSHLLNWERKSCLDGGFSCLVRSHSKSTKWKKWKFEFWLFNSDWKSLVLSHIMYSPS